MGFFHSRPSMYSGKAVVGCYYRHFMNTPHGMSYYQNELSVYTQTKKL